MSLRQFIASRGLLRPLSAIKNTIVYSGDEAARIPGLQAVGQQNPALLSSPIEVSVESHRITYAAEKSRVERTIEYVHL